MNRLKIFGFLFLGMILISGPAYSKISMIQGEILRFYETRENDWSSYILIRDSFNKEFKFQVHPNITAIRRGSQMEDVGQLTGGMKVTIIYKKDKKGVLQASVIQIGGVIRV